MADNFKECFSTSCVSFERQRKCLLEGNMKYKALGGSVACPIATIDEICNRIKYIKDLQDVCVIPCLPHVFAESFFNVIKDVLDM